RWPNTDVIPDITQRQAAWSTAGAILDQDVGGDTKRDVGRYTVPGIDGFPTDALAGAQIQINPNKQWGTRQAKVTANAGQDITFEFSRATTAGTAYGHNGDPFSRDPVIVWDTPVVLDRDDEFWIDLAGRIGPANTLYVQRSTPPTGLAFGIERPGAAPLIKISNRSHLVLRGFETVGGATGTTSTTTAAIRFESMTFRLSSPGLGGGGHLSLSGDGHAVVDCEFIDSHGPAITFGYGNQVSTNVTIEECRFSMVKDALSSGGTVAWPDNLVFRHNTVSDIAGSGISFNAVDSDFGYNHVYRAGLNSADISLINAVGSPPQGPLHTRVHHNWAYAPRAAKDGRSQRWLGCNGIRTDSGFDDTGGIAGVTIDRNVVWGDGLNTGIQIFTNLPGKWGGGGAKGDSVDVIVAHNTVAASGYIQGCINLVGRSNAKGIEIVNNIASAYTIDTSIRSGASAPTLVASNLFTAGASNLPTDNDTRVTGRNLERIDPRFEDSVKRDFRLAAGSPAIDAGVVHATSGTYAGSAPDIGAYERGEALWIAGARVQPRHVPALEVRPVVDPDGTRWAVVDNLPKGRLLPVGTRLRIGSVEFADGTWSYDPAEDRGRLWFAVGAQEFADGTAAAVDLGGTGTWTALDAPVGGLMRRVAGMTWNDAAQTMEVLGGGLYGSAWTLTPVALDRPSMGDLRQRPVYGAVDLAGRDPDRFDLVAVTTGQAIPLNHSQDRIAGGLRYGWAVLPDRQSDVFGPATGVRLYATERTGGGPRTHSAPSLSGALPDGRPEEVSFSALTNPFLLAHFRPEDAVTVGASVSAWTDRIGGYTASAATLTARPERVDGLLSGLPGIRFDGTSDGLAFRSGQADGQFMAAAVHRNAGDGLAPGSAGYQRLVATAGSGTAAFGLSDTTSTGAAVARAAPWAVASTANAIFGRDEIRIGANGSTRYAGVIGEIMLFSSLASDDDPWAPNGWGNDKAARDYLQTKYRNGPAGRIGTGSGAGIPAATLRFAGVDLELVWVEGGRM
ncbi:MAG: hypothetical protein RLZZ127_3312, partial [Planctomycetota bacterium]